MLACSLVRARAASGAYACAGSHRLSVRAPAGAVNRRACCRSARAARVPAVGTTVTHVPGWRASGVPRSPCLEAPGPAARRPAVPVAVDVRLRRPSGRANSWRRPSGRRLVARCRCDRDGFGKPFRSPAQQGRLAPELRLAVASISDYKNVVTWGHGHDGAQATGAEIDVLAGRQSQSLANGARP